MNNDRFVVTYKQGDANSGGSVQILLDQMTGVNYLSTEAGLTPLLGANGEPVIHRTSQQQTNR